MAVPVIAIDGPSALGKGTVTQRVAEALGWHYLDSGALYRLTALAARKAGVDWNNEAAVAHIAAHLPVHFAGGLTFLGDEAVDDQMRTEEMGIGASRVVPCLPCVKPCCCVSGRFVRRLAWWRMAAIWGSGGLSRRNDQGFSHSQCGGQGRATLQAVDGKRFFR